jgi:predicted helicase
MYFVRFFLIIFLYVFWWRGWELNPRPEDSYPLEVETLNFNEVFRVLPGLITHKESGVIEIDTITKLIGVPQEAWEYRLGTYTALEWILECFKEKKPKDPTIAEKFNIHKFADYKEQVIILLLRVCTVSVETMKIIAQIPCEN